MCETTFNKEWREYIKNIIRQNQLVIGYLLGFTFLKILSPMNKDISTPVRLIPTIILCIIIALHFLDGYGNHYRIIVNILVF